MKDLKSFLQPKRKENLKFVLSDAFVGEDGKPLEWEMRQLTAQEGIEYNRNLGDKPSYMDIMVGYVARALVYPDLRDAELLRELSKQHGKPILNPEEALKLLTNDNELARLIELYNQHNNLTESFAKKVDEAKN